MNNINKKKRKKSINVTIKSVQNTQKFEPNPKTSKPYPVALYEKERKDKENMRTILGEAGWRPEMPAGFCAVRQVIALVPWTPSEPKVFKSAWIPAPPPLSEPAMVRATGCRFRFMDGSIPGCGRLSVVERRGEARHAKDASNFTPLPFTSGNRARPFSTRTPVATSCAISTAPSMST